MRVERVVVAVFVVACRELRCDWSNLELSPPSNVPGLHSGEMAFESEPPEVTDVFLLRSTLRSPRFDVLLVPVTERNAEK